MDSKTENGDAITVLLGNEYDDELREKLKDVLKRLGVVSLVRTELSFPGSGLEQWEGVADGGRLLVEAEAYVGLSISGPSDFIQKVQSLLK